MYINNDDAHRKTNTGKIQWEFRVRTSGIMESIIAKMSFYRVGRMWSHKEKH